MKNPDPSDRDTLDPADWPGFRKRARAMLDATIDRMEHYGDGPVWTEPPALFADTSGNDLPRQPGSSDATDQFLKNLMPHGMGNTHPRFFGWVNGSGTPTNLIPELVASAMNANLGARNHAAHQVEKKIGAWVRTLFGFPEGASGLLVSGTSIATLIALKAARDRATEFASRKNGIPAGLTGYTSEQTHSCVSRTFDILGLGADALRQIPTDDQFCIDVDALRDAIAEDRAAGLTPFIVIGTAGSVNTGAIDDLTALADVTAAEDLWFHVDGAFGATIITSQRKAPLLAGIERADSIAFDFHKWLHVNYDAGYVLMRSETDHRSAFSVRPAYLRGTDRGLAAGNPWPMEYGPELSRGFRALKVFAQLYEIGTDRLGEAIANNCDQAAWLGDAVSAHEQLELLAPVQLNICCFRFNDGEHDDAALDAINDEIVILLQERGLAAPSTTTVSGCTAIRVNITNHRTQLSDLQFLHDAVLSIGAELTAMDAWRSDACYGS